jgi:hypothetical protein
MLIDANMRAKNETILDIKPKGPSISAPMAIIAPTIITAEIAFVTDIRGV